MESTLTEIWYGEPRRGALLQPLAWLYGSISRARRRAYATGLLKTHHVGRPTIVVGNLTVGGTGKTPLVAWLADQLTTHKLLRVGIASRGYGSKGEGPRTVRSDSPWQEFGDEPVLLHRRTGCMTVVSRDRVAAARMLVQQGVDVVITDDGLQHLRLARDCEIVVIDGTRGFGNGRLLPAGPLREPPSRARNADVIVVNGSAKHPSFASLISPDGPPVVRMLLVPGNAIALTDERDAVPLEDFSGKRVHAVAAIGNPQRFFAQLREHGVDVIEHAFPDHHAFSAADLDFADDLPVLMTEKDAVKCRSFARPGMRYIPVSVRFSESDARVLLERVMRRLSDGRPAA
jgi:tetraacyldisaccharide 4'-kinase